MKRASLFASAVALSAATLFAGCGGGPEHRDAAAVAQAEQTDRPDPVDRTKLPEPGPRPDWAPPEVTRFELSNGIDVWYLRQDLAPLVSLELVVPRGAATDPEGKAGLTTLTADMLDEGAGERSALEISEELQRLATDYGADVGTDAVTVGMDMLADKVEPSLALLRDLLRAPTFPAEEFERRKAQHIAAAIAAEADPGNARMLVLRRALFADGYGGAPPGGTRATLEGITLEDVKAHFGRVFTPEGTSVVVVGDIDREALEPLLEKTLGDWKGSAEVKAAPLAEAEPKRAIYLVDYPGTTQSAIAVARRAPGMKTDEYFEALVYNRVVGGSFTSRVNMNLREQKGYTYGAGSAFNRWREAGFYWMAANVKTEVTRESIDEMLRELADCAEKRPVTAEEREQAIGGLLLGFPGQWERMSAVARQLVDLPLYDRPADWYNEWPERVQAVGLDAVNALARAYGDLEDYVIVVAGDASKVEPSLKSLGLPILRYDAQGNPVQ